LSLYGKDIQRGDEHSGMHWNSVNPNGPVSELEKFMEQMMKGSSSGGSDKSNKKVKGVIIRCEGEIGLHRKQTGKWERYVETTVDKNNEIWKSDPTPASIVMGLPLLVQQMPHNPLWDDKQVTRFDNQPATYLNIKVDPKDPQLWGFAPPKWQNSVGNILLVRKDGKDLSREQAWAIAEFMQFRVSDVFGEILENGGGVKEKRAAVLKMLNWKMFESFLDNFRVEMMGADGKSWKDVRSPFGTREGSDGKPF
jgi:hypothetical protein